MGVSVLDGRAGTGKGMNDSRERLPTGFQGPVRGWRSLVPTANRVLRWPGDAAEWRARGERDPGYDLIEVTALTESLGRPEDALAAFAKALSPNGTLLLDVENAQCSRELRLVLEGRPGSFDAFGSTDDPSVAMLLRRLVAAVAATGLVIEDVLHVPDVAGEFSAQFCAALVAQGLLPFDWVDGNPPGRFWVVAHKQSPLAGSVVVAGGDAAAQARTRDCVARYLPADWEIVVGEGVRESAQWNRGIHRARGELIWLLRGGAEPGHRLFEVASVQAGIGPVAPGQGGERSLPGDVCGTMLARTDLMVAGPIGERVANTNVALEDYCMRMDVRLSQVLVLDEPLAAPPVPVEAPRVLAQEAAALTQRWGRLTDARQSGAGDSAIGQTAGSALPATQAAAPDCPCPWTGRRPRISLCMIAKNEERFLDECLSRVKGAVDEIVLVDTGSTDRTIEIAVQHGAIVLERPWDDDFAAPRTFGLQHATGDWILVLDADEFVQEASVAKLRELCENPRIGGYHLHFVNVYGHGRTAGVMMVRLFRNLPGLEYQNVIHEQVTPSLQRACAERGLAVVSCGVVVDHHGYSDEIMDLRGKNERNERLFKKQLQRHPDDIYSHYKYGDFLRRVPGRGAEARAELDLCLQMLLDAPPSAPRGMPFAGEVAALCALEAARAGAHARARAVLDTALRRFLPTPNLHYLSASLALAEGRANDAIVHYRRCLAYRGQVLVVPIQEGVTSYVSLTGIAQAWLLRGELDRAQRLLEQSIALEPGYEVAHLVLSRLHLQRGDIARALQVMTRYLTAHPDSPGACQQTTLILHRLGRTAEAKRLGQHAVRLLEERALDHEAAAMSELLATL